MRTIIILLTLNINFLFGQNCWDKVIPAKGTTGGGFIIGLTSEGKLYSWGSNNYGQLGIGNFINKNTPTQIGLEQDWKTFEVGNANVIAIKNNGTLWTWGSGESIGHGSLTNKSVPTQVGIENDWKDVFAGDFNVYAIKNNGTLWATGRNAYSSLGNGNSIIQYNFIQIGTDSDWAKISGGNVFTLGIKTNGSLWSWGSDSIGQLGNGSGSFSDVSTPTQISNLVWFFISAGSDYALATRNNGTLWAWGKNSNGQLGINSTTSQSSPIQVGTDTDWVRISAGSQHSTATKVSGQLFVWGRNLYSALGLSYDENALGNVNVPYPLNLTNDWSKINNGSFNSTGLKQNGSLYVWGRGSNGELGNNTNSYAQSIPLLVNCPSTLAIDQIQKSNNISIYPNPFKDLLTIQTTDDNLQTIKLIDFQGRIIRDVKVSGTSYQLNLENLYPQFYLLEISSEKAKQSVKVVKY